VLHGSSPDSPGRWVLLLSHFLDEETEAQTAKASEEGMKAGGGVGSVFRPSLQSKDANDEERVKVALSTFTTLPTLGHDSVSGEIN
jgi:hypothetical protein